ncbi:MAG TPA: hypothetical protein VF733_02880 [Candidatus Saccharimonadales bacterium]
MSYATFEQLRPALIQANENLDGLYHSKPYEHRISGATEIQNILHVPDCGGLFLDYPTDARPNGLVSAANRDHDNPFHKGASGQMPGFRIYSHLPAEGCEFSNLLEATTYSYTSEVVSDKDAPLRLLCSHTTLEQRVDYTAGEPLLFTERQKTVQRTIEKGEDGAWRSVPSPGQEEITPRDYITLDHNPKEFLHLDTSKAQEFIARAVALVIGVAGIIEARDV